MIEKHFTFADFVDEFRVPFTAFVEGDGNYNAAGKWIEGEPQETQMQGIILPLSNDELQFEANGVYTKKDRKIYVTEPLKIGQKIKYDGQSFMIDSEKPYSVYADVYIYFAKGVDV